MKQVITLVLLSLLTTRSFAANRSATSASFRDKQKIVQIAKRDLAVMGALESAPQKFCRVKKIEATKLSFPKTKKAFDFDLTIACEDSSSQTVINVKGTAFKAKIEGLSLTRDWIN